MERFMNVTVVSMYLAAAMVVCVLCASGCTGDVDTDLDGVPDRMDNCPDGEPGDPTYDGCSQGGLGGPTDDAGRPVLHMPFAHAVRSQCTQGAGGGYSHNGWSTRYDVDFDTPNPPNDPFVVTAPVGGTVYVHNSGASGFGLHVNVDMGNGQYAVLGHLRSVDVSTGQYVSRGERLGVAGCTGNCSGDHVHLGVHEGSAGQSAASGESVPSSVFGLDVSAGGSPSAHATTSMTCALSGGHVYESRNEEGDESEAHSDEDDPCEDDDDDVTPPADDDDDTYEPPADDDDTTPDDSDDGVVELCWLPLDLDNPHNGELWVSNGGWQTVASDSGWFSSLCGEVNTLDSSVLIVNGEYGAFNTPSSPWWICANIGEGHFVYGVFEVDGQLADVSPLVWGEGCDALVYLP